jgi:hypothetical protein
MRKISSFVVIASLILGATGIGVWAASRATNHVNVEATREGIPVGGAGIFVVPQPTF